MTCACRFISGCAMRKQSFEGALCSLEAAWSSKKVGPPQLMAQAHSLNAHAQYGSPLHILSALTTSRTLWLFSPSLLD